MLSLQLLKLLHNCEDHFNFYSLSAVHIYDLYHIHIISVHGVSPASTRTHTLGVRDEAVIDCEDIRRNQVEWLPRSSGSLFFALLQGVYQVVCLTSNFRHLAPDHLTIPQPEKVEGLV